jgi:hypothetical protein
MRSTTPTLVGRLSVPRRRRMKLAAADRVCAHPGCTTRLTRYNRADHCYQHRARRYPRVRGVQRG